MTDPLLAVEDLHTHLQTPDGIVRAVDGVNFTVSRGEIVCLVGESGSGKSLTCDTIAGLVGPPAEHSGQVRFDGHEVLSMAPRDRRAFRGDRIGYVFQNAQVALDPVYTVGEQLIEAMRFHGSIDDREARSRAVSLLREVELSRPSERIDQYPHELSDGMCQRVALGIGLAAKPDLLIADEPTSALDVIIQANILERLRDLRRDRSLAVLLVTHDLRVAASIADRVVVLYGGTVVERGPISAVFERPSHPYTQALIESFTAAEDEHTGAVSLPSRGCRFHRECPLVVDACRQERPSLEAVETAEGHRAACVHHAEDGDASLVAERIPETAVPTSIGGDADE